MKIDYNLFHTNLLFFYKGLNKTAIGNNSYLIEKLIYILVLVNCNKNGLILDNWSKSRRSSRNNLKKNS